MDQSDASWKTYARYMNDGYEAKPTASSMLMSSSQYLNDPRVREWTTRECLRRNGLDLPTTYGIPDLNLALEEHIDRNRINELFEAARKDWPELDQFLGERYLSKWRKDDLTKFPVGSVGHAVWKQFDTYGYDNTLAGSALPVRDHCDFFRRRKVEIHDFMHVLTGAGFDYLGEAVPNMIHFGSFHKYFVPELAHNLTISNMFLFFPYFMRSSLHYPQGFPWLWDLMNRGVEIGRQSGPYFLKRIEDYLHLSLPEAREALEIRGVEDLDLAEWARRSDVIMEGGQTYTEQKALARKKAADEEAAQRRVA